MEAEHFQSVCHLVSTIDPALAIPEKRVGGQTTKEMMLKQVAQ